MAIPVGTTTIDMLRNAFGSGAFSNTQLGALGDVIDYRARETTVSAAGGIAAAGTTQATATPLTATMNFVVSGAAASGVVAVYEAIGRPQTVVNKTAVNIVFYAPSGATVDSEVAAAGVGVGPGGVVTMIPETATLWRTY